MDEPQSFNNAPTRSMRSMRSMRDSARNAIGRSWPLRILVGIALIALVAAAIWGGVFAARQPRPSFATARVGDVILSVQVNGAIQATTYQADFAVNGALSEIDVTLGQQVHRGDTLAKLDVAPFQSALTAAQNTASAAQQSLGAAQDAQSQAETAVSSAEDALSAQQSYAQLQCSSQPNDPDACAAANAAAARAQAQVDASQAQLAASQAQIATAKKSVTTAQGKTKIAQAQLASATLIAPHAGVIAEINGAVGGKPGVTEHGSGPFILIMDTSAPLVTTLVGYRDIGEVKAGETATFRVAQVSASDVFTGSVMGVSPLGQGTGSALSYPVALRLDPASLGKETLLPGMTAATRIITRARYRVLVIPNSAVSYARQEAPSSGSGLLTRSQIAAAQQSARSMAQAAVAAGFDVANDPLTPTYLVGYQQNHYVAIPVVLGLTDGDQWEVVSGLTRGQQVVSGQRNLLFG